VRRRFLFSPANGDPTMKLICNEKRVQEAAQFIAAELSQILFPRLDGIMTQRMKVSCPAYKNITNSEMVLAQLRALSALQIKRNKDFTELTLGEWEDDGDGDESEAA
jgi:hypothetical protein